MPEDKLNMIKEALDSPINKQIGELPLKAEINESSKFIGEALSQDIEINQLETSSKPNITILIGFEGFGKTSFVASFYHRLLAEGEMQGYKFVDSDTLIGLERRLFLRRLNSKNEKIPPTTLRTIRGEAHILDFRLQVPQGNEKLLIFSDHSGEDYKDYAEQRDKVSHDILFKYADRIIFFVDSQILVSKQYLMMLQKYEDLLGNIINQNVLNSKTELYLLFNKIDLINHDNNKEFNERKEKIKNVMTDKLNRTFEKSYEVVANKENDSGLSEVFKDIISSFDEDKKSIDSTTKMKDWENILFQV